jgi:5-methyltetrahydrofolate--homocysteine methyltransferase
MSINDIRQAVLSGDEEGAASLARAELEAGTTAAEIMDSALISAMDEAGAKMATGELFIPEVLVAADAMKAAMDVITPHLAVEAAGSRGTVVIGAVEGDVHDIGKSLVALMLDGAGFTVFDLGVDVTPAAFVASAKEHDADIVAMSSLMVTTMPKMKVVIEALHEAGCAARPIVGGAPLTQAYADEIGAAGYAPDAGGAVKLVRDLV